MTFEAILKGSGPFFTLTLGGYILSMHRVRASEESYKIMDHAQRGLDDGFNGSSRTPLSPEPQILPNPKPYS